MEAAMEEPTAVDVAVAMVAAATHNQFTADVEMPCRDARIADSPADTVHTT